MEQILLIEKQIADDPSSVSNHSLGYYYQGIRYYDLMEKYYKKAIDEEECSKSMYALGWHYQYVHVYIASQLLTSLPLLLVFKLVTITWIDN